MNYIRSTLVSYEHEIDTLMSKTDWLNVMSEVIQSGVDMDLFIREHRHPDEYQEDLDRGKTPALRAAQELGIDENDFDWDKLGDHASYIKNLQIKSGEYAQKNDVKANTERMLEFMAAHDTSGSIEKASDGEKK